MGFLDLPAVSRTRRVCRVLRDVPLESYLTQAFERSLPTDAARLQRILAKHVCSEAAWPMVARRFAMPAILRVSGLDLGPCLLDSARNGLADVVNALLDAGGTVEVRDCFGRTGLHWAARNGHTAVDALLAAGAAVDAKDKRGRTSLHLAARDGCTAVTTLLAARAAVNATDKYHRTALHDAAENGHTAACAALVAAGADVDIEDVDGNRPKVSNMT